jgi:membrane protein required for colicin V production
MNVFDALVLFCLGYGLIRGLVKGFIIEISGVLALVLGVFGALQFATGVTYLIKDWIALDSRLIQGISFLLLFIAITYGISLLAKMLTKTLQIVALGLFNRLAGGLFGLIKWTLILTAIVLLFNQVDRVLSIVPEAFLAESISHPILLEFSGILFEWIQVFEPLPPQELI